MGLFDWFMKAGAAPATSGAEPVATPHNETIATLMSAGKFGLARNAFLDAADAARKAQDHPLGVHLYSVVVYLDLNGVSNEGSYDKEEVFLAPVVVERLVACAQTVGLDKDQLQQAFLAAAEKHKRPRMIATPHRRMAQAGT